MQDCIFCKIISGEIPSRKVYENEWVFCIEDIAPKAPVHILILPKKHISGIAALEEQDGAIVYPMMRAAQIIAKQKGIDQSGFRLVINNGKHGCQSVAHLHMHLLGGAQLSENMV